MEQDPRTSKEILLIILQKCKSALPQVATLMKRLQKIPHQQQKIKKKDCLNPKFLLQLSKCGQQIRQILQQAIDQQRTEKDALKKYFKQYMDVIYSIRQYHQQAHRSHDIHKNSTYMKEILIEQLKKQSLKCKDLENKVEQLRDAIADRDRRICELEQNNGDKENHLNISSEISQISKKHQRKYGQLYGGESKVGQLEEDLTVIEGKRLRKRIVELQQLLDEKQIMLEQLKAQIQELQNNVNELYPEQSKEVKKNNFNEFKATSPNSRETTDDEQMLRYLLTQAVTIEQYIKQSDQ